MMSAIDGMHPISIEEPMGPETSQDTKQPEDGKKTDNPQEGSRSTILSRVKGCVASALGDVQTAAKTALDKVPHLETTQHRVVLPYLFSEGSREVTVSRPVAGTEAQQLIRKTQEEIEALFPSDSKNRPALEASLATLREHPSCILPKDVSKRCMHTVEMGVYLLGKKMKTLAKEEAEDRASMAYYERQKMNALPLPEDYPDSDEALEMFFIGWGTPKSND